MLPLISRAPAPITCVLIRNPASRHTLDDAALARVLDEAARGGWHVEPCFAEFPGHTTELARQAASNGAQVVLVYGGDGTINEAVNGIAGSRAALAVLPGGTANVWAKEVRISRDPVAAMRAAIDGERRQVDLGRAGGRYFLLMAGVGLDGEVIERVRPDAKRRFGALSYLMAAVPTALSTRPWQARLRIDGEEIDTALYWMVIGNTRSYGGFRDITHRAQADDGKLDVAIMQRGGVVRLAIDGMRMLVGRHDRSPNIRYLRATAVTVETAGLPVQVDGEPVGETPMIFEIAPRALTVIVPRGLRTPLLGSADDAPAS
ncbi:MAG: diacylglycerol/lipid kinase family protein [Dehalococcoidia bacterium]